MNGVRPGSPGFTLIEVLVAIVLLSVISLISWKGLDSVARSSQRLERSGEQSTAILRTLRQFELDVAARATTELPPLDSGEPAEVDEDGRPIPRRLLPDAMVSTRQGLAPLRIEIVRRAADGDGRWQRVAWWRQRDTLYRAAARASDRFPLPAPASAEAVAVLEGVSDFEIRAWEPDHGWQRLPSSTPARQATGLEVTLGQRDERGNAVYRRVLLL
ncbi:prepilin-type N-terminal cleavage/methylation domain-containing protein [[Pseudomonas] boreopolis]|uniref:prepilin-type N-terminal cleavage/methylation domain-containing protein n=1 Tax=Xanthomonas boreopolis TaxID=86183 RepID=UPI003D588503